MTRVFLGWDEPLLTHAVAWLLQRRDELPKMLVVVPTAQSGRRLREALAEKAGALLSPKVVTPGSLLKSRDEESAPDWIERLAWIEVLENIGDWAEYTALFPEPPAEGANWANGLALEMTRLRHMLQENGLLLETAARKLDQTVEAERWDALAKLENLVEQKLKIWNLKSRSKILSSGVSISPEISHIVLAGVPEIPPLVGRALLTWEKPMTVLIGAPESEIEKFSSLGIPKTSWSQEPLPWPNGSIQVLADPQQQAAETLKIIGKMKTSSQDVALGSADADVGNELARVLSGAGWPAFHPAAAMVAGGLVRWFKIWANWLADPTLATLADLLTFQETGVLVAGKRAQKSKCLAELRDRWMIIRTGDLQRRIAAGACRNESEKESAEELLKAAESLEIWRRSLLNENFSSALQRLLEILSRTGSKTKEDADLMLDWLTEASLMIAKVKRSSGFWIETMLSEMPTPTPLPPAGRVIDVQGWLELFHEPGKHLILCGMNEGKVPARSGGEPWLSEASRDLLGLIKDEDRAARDAFLYRSMLAARCHGGRVDVICGKTGAGGESLLPSRLLLAAERNELPARVTTLFREIEPPDASLRWEKDFVWKPRQATPPQRLNVTSLRDYLACPFRYYLKHVLKMQASGAGRREWNARDFGTVAHEVLERWGRDTEARESTNPESIHDWLSAELDRVVLEWFGKHVPLAIRIQTEALRQRFVWLSEVQAKNRLDGWQVVDVERKVELPVGDALIVAKIDRIDQNQETGRLRVLDYKTGKVDDVAKAHRKKLSESTLLPLHLSRECPAVYEGEEKGKSAEFLWQNLQLPLYASALVKRGETMPTPCYFSLGATAADVEIHEWGDFEMADLDAAQACADWVAGQIAAGVFWPPAEKVMYDDYEILTAGKTLEEMVDFTSISR